MFCLSWSLSITARKGGDALPILIHVVRVVTQRVAPEPSVTVILTQNLSPKTAFVGIKNGLGLVILTHREVKVVGELLKLKLYWYEKFLGVAPPADGCRAMVGTEMPPLPPLSNVGAVVPGLTVGSIMIRRGS